MMYTVRQVAELSGISVRTLHHYDAIGLLRPARVGMNSYRYYDDDSLVRLQQILFYREVGLELAHIRDILDDPDFDLHAALHSHRETLLAQAQRLHELIETIDDTLNNLDERGMTMGNKLFKGFNAAQQQHYEREIRLEYGTELVNESKRRWGGYDAHQKRTIMDSGSALYEAIAAAIRDGEPAEGERVQALLALWHQHLRHFYEPTYDILRGLGELYTSHPDFVRNFSRLHPQLGEFMRAGIAVYVDALEDAELRALLAADEAAKPAHDEA